MESGCGSGACTEFLAEMQRRSDSTSGANHLVHLGQYVDSHAISKLEKLVQSWAIAPPPGPAGPGTLVHGPGSGPGSLAENRALKQSVERMWSSWTGFTTESR
jgi:hypothetical protein